MSVDPSVLLLAVMVVLTMVAALEFATAKFAYQKPEKPWDSPAAKVLRKQEKTITRGIGRLSAFGAVLCALLIVITSF